MTVTSTASSTTQQGNGATTSWPFGFPIPGATPTDQSNVLVVIVDQTVTPPTRTVLSNSQYSVTGISTVLSPSNSGMVTYPLSGTPLVAGQFITIQRNLPEQQTTSLPNQGPWQAKVVEAMIDYVTMLIQGGVLGISLALQNDPSDPAGAPAVLPLTSLRKNQGAVWDANGNLIAGAVGSVPVNVAMTGLVQAVSIAAARAFLGIKAAGLEGIGNGLQDDGSGNLTLKLLAQASGLALTASGVSADPSFWRGFVDGFEQGAAGGNNTITWGPGACVDSTNAFLIKDTTAAFTKTLASWAVGSGNGGLDTGTTGGAINTPYFLHVIFNPTTGAVDRLISLSATAPTLPTGFTVFRCIGWAKTDGSKNFLQFQQRGDEFLYGVTVADASATAFADTIAHLLTLTVPTGFQVDALFRSVLSPGTSANQLLLTSPDETDQAPSTGLASLTAAASGAAVGAEFIKRTNTSAQIRYRGAAANGSVWVQTYGFRWSRGRNS